MSLFIEDIFGFRSPWGVNSIVSFSKTIASEGEIGPIADHFAAMLKHGTVSPVAATLLPHIDYARDVISDLAAACPHHWSETRQIVAWLYGASVEDLTTLGMSEVAADHILGRRDRARGWRKASTTGGRRSTVRLPVPRDRCPSDLAVGDSVLVLPSPGEEPNIFSVLTIGGELVGRYRYRDANLPSWWTRTSLASASVLDMDDLDDERLSVRVVVNEV